MAWVSNYFWTHYFYDVLGVSYTFPAWRFNNVPFCLYLMSHSYFAAYHTLSNLALRAVSAKTKGSTKMLAQFAVISFMSFTFAFLEAFTLQSVTIF